MVTQLTTYFVLSCYSFKQVREATMSDLGMSDSNRGSHSARNLKPKPVGRVRVTVRRSGYLSCPQDDKVHMDIERKTQMSEHLVYFIARASQMRITYIHNKICGNDCAATIIPITSTDAATEKSIESKTVKQIDEIIIKVLDKLPRDVASVMDDDYRRNYHKSRKTKGALIEFYYRVLEELEAHDNEQENDTDEHDICD